MPQASWTCASAQTTQVQAGSVAIGNLWACAAVQGGTEDVFLTIRNSGQEAHRLIFLASPSARAAEQHVTPRDGDVMRRRPVQAIEAPARGSVTLRPGGLHVMLVGLVRRCEPGAVCR